MGRVKNFFPGAGHCKVRNLSGKRAQPKRVRGKERKNDERDKTGLEGGNPLYNMDLETRGHEIRALDPRAKPPRGKIRLTINTKEKSRRWGKGLGGKQGPPNRKKLEIGVCPGTQCEAGEERRTGQLFRAGTGS